jgi:hypothetical protein
MRNCAVAAIVSIVVAFPPALNAQGAKDPSAMALLTQASAALSGQAVSVKTARASGTYVRNIGGGKTAAYDVTMVAVAPDRVRWDIAGASGKTTTVILGNSGWTLTGGKRKPLAIDELAGKGLERFPLLLISAWISDAKLNVADMGTAVANGIGYRQIEATRAMSRAAFGNRAPILERSTQMDLFLDAQTGMPVWLRYYQNPVKLGNMLAVNYLFSELKDIAGAVVPMTVTVRFDKQVLGVLRFDDVKVNVAVTPEDFKE